jgi:hypothetical protein
MDPISNADRLALILRQRLQERSRTSAERKGRKEADRGGRPEAADQVRAVAAMDGADERQQRRALVQAMLADQFGRELINEPEFQQVVDRVVETIESDSSSAELMGRVLGDLKAGR